MGGDKQSPMLGKDAERVQKEKPGRKGHHGRQSGRHHADGDPHEAREVGD